MRTEDLIFIRNVLDEAEFARFRDPEVVVRALELIEAELSKSISDTQEVTEYDFTEVSVDSDTPEVV